MHKVTLYVFNETFTTLRTSSETLAICQLERDYFYLQFLGSDVTTAAAISIEMRRRLVHNNGADSSSLDNSATSVRNANSQEYHLLQH
jgi:hypothetical protein